jgi:hypothetical protein
MAPMDTSPWTRHGTRSWQRGDFTKISEAVFLMVLALFLLNMFVGNPFFDGF